MTDKSKPVASPQSNQPIVQNIAASTSSYETWLRHQIHVDERGLAFKHEQMSLSPFIFMRATFYRFAEIWRTQAGKVEDAPEVLAVGDLHIENFGTWRDSEGRLIWGINDFDETCRAPFTLDLVRLAASAELAIRECSLQISPSRAFREIVSGYKDSIKAGGRPFVLAEDHAWLRDVALTFLKKPAEYWQHLLSLPRDKTEFPSSAQECLDRLLPDRNMKSIRVRRIAGEGSLGRPRFTSITTWHGGYVARDIKAMLPSAWQWAHNQDGPYEILYAVAVGRAVRCQDPLVHSTGQWIGRRIAPDCSRIELAKIVSEDDEARLLYSMGWETANVHLGTKNSSKPILKFLAESPKSWLGECSKKIVDTIDSDWEEWKKCGKQT